MCRWGLNFMGFLLILKVCCVRETCFGLDFSRYKQGGDKRGNVNSIPSLDGGIRGSRQTLNGINSFEEKKKSIKNSSSKKKNGTKLSNDPKNTKDKKKEKQRSKASKKATNKKKTSLSLKKKKEKETKAPSLEKKKLKIKKSKGGESLSPCPLLPIELLPPRCKDFFTRL